MNVWTVSGNVGADAELRSTANGEKVLSFRLANSIGFGDRKTVQWADCSYWGKRAEAVANYIKKGDRITVSGELRLEEYQARDGSTKSKLTVRVNDLDLASRNDSAGGGDSGGSEARGGGNRDAGSRGGSGGGNRGGGKPAFDQNLDDEIPFVFCTGYDSEGCACATLPRARAFRTVA